MGELYRNDYYVVVWLKGEPFLRLTRTAKAFFALSDAERSNDEVAEALRPHNVRRMLMDLRFGPPGRNDEPFEQVSARWRRILATLFDRRAVLVKSAVGKLQVKRLTKGADNILITQDEEEALTFLR